MNVHAYLERLGVTPAEHLNIEYLTHIQTQHYMSIPFENLDIIDKIPLSLDYEKLYEKIVINKRGGLCFELNTLLCAMLQQLGFDAHLISGTVLDEDGHVTLEDSHTLIFVMLDQPYIVDVGFGNSCRVPLPLSGKEIEDVSGTYRIHSIESTYYFQQKKDGEWSTMFRFSTIEKFATDFTPSCHFHQTSSDSIFNQDRRVTIATPTGRITLIGNTLTIKDGEPRKIEIQEMGFPYILEKYFGIKK